MCRWKTTASIHTTKECASPTIANELLMITAATVAKEKWYVATADVAWSIYMQKWKTLFSFNDLGAH